MRQPRRLTTLWAFTAYCRDSFTFNLKTNVCSMSLCEMLTVSKWMLKGTFWSKVYLLYESMLVMPCVGNLTEEVCVKNAWIPYRRINAGTIYTHTHTHTHSDDNVTDHVTTCLRRAHVPVTEYKRVIDWGMEKITRYLPFTNSFHYDSRFL
jgi:hypothetical protein